jgi:hypothetical protein
MDQDRLGVCSRTPSLPTGEPQGKKLLGFLNPILYQMAVNKPTAFTDITTGTIKGTMGYTCQYGWTATSGWDPASGVRSPLNHRHQNQRPH